MFLKKNTMTMKLVLSALMTALAVVLGLFFSISIPLGGVETLRINFMMVPIYFISIILGPKYGAITSMAADIINFFIKGTGALLLPMTLTMGLMGLLPGLFFLKKQSIGYVRLLLAVFTSQVIGSVFLNTLILHIAFAQPIVLMWPRLIVQPFYIVVFPLILLSMIQALQKANLLQKSEQMSQKTKTEKLL